MIGVWWRRVYGLACPEALLAVKAISGETLGRIMYVAALAEGLYMGKPVFSPLGTALTFRGSDGSSPGTRVGVESNTSQPMGTWRAALPNGHAALTRQWVNPWADDLHRSLFSADLGKQSPDKGYQEYDREYHQDRLNSTVQRVAGNMAMLQLFPRASMDLTDYAYAHMKEIERGVGRKQLYEFMFEHLGLSLVNPLQPSFREKRALVPAGECLGRAKRVAGVSWW